jgi:hypothetical protein
MPTVAVAIPTRAFPTWRHEKLTITSARVRSIRPVRDEGGTLVALDEHRGEPCACCDSTRSSVVQLCGPCRLLLCPPCAAQLVRLNRGQCVRCFTTISGTHPLDSAYAWPGKYEPAPPDMGHADAQRRYSLQRAYSFIGVRERGELIEYRLGQVVRISDADIVAARRLAERRNRGRAPRPGGGDGPCGPGIGAFDTFQGTHSQLEYFDIPAWARVTVAQPPSSSSSSSSLSSPSPSAAPALVGARSIKFIE